jgi:hypothetical protein
MRLVAFALLALLVISKAAAAADAAENPGMAAFVKMCQTAPCRKNVEFRLKKPDGSYFIFKSPLAPPVVQPNSITVYPGETLDFEADENPDSTLTLHLVSRVEHPEKTITVSLAQAATVADGTGMIFSIKNPFDRDIRYHMGIMSLAHERIVATSTCPVLKKIFGIEHWPYPLFQVIIGKVGFMKTGEPRSCEE